MKVFAILGLTLAIAAAEPGPVVKAVGPWVVDFDTRHCSASHEFNADGTSLMFGIEAVPTQEGRYIYFQRPGKLRTMEIESADVRLGGKRIRSGMMAMPVVQKGNVRYSITLQPDEFRLFLDGTPLSVRSSYVKATLPPMRLNAVDAQLVNCMSMMLERWGLSREEQSKLASFPKLKPAKRASAQVSYYPDGAQRRGAMGNVRLIANIDETGKVADCRVMRSSGHADLDSDACSVLRTRTQFEPARDRQGRSVPSLFLVDFSYLLISFF